MRRGLIAGAAAAVLVGAVAVQARGGSGHLTVGDVRLPQPVSSAGTAVVYATIRNGTGTADRLVSVRSSVGSATNLMQETEQGGVGYMTNLTGIDVPAHSSVSLSPGRSHAMISAVGTLAVGTRVTVTFTFAHAGDVTVQTTVAGL